MTRLESQATQMVRLLPGRTLSAAEVRAQITQIEKYNAAVNTFRGKFNAIPGDMNVATAQQFGFTVGIGCIGQQGGRDGNGLLDGYLSPVVLGQNTGETELFWADLSSSVAGNLIDGNFPGGGLPGATCTGGINALSTTPGVLYLGNALPVAKIGHGNYIYVYELKGLNWFGLSAVTAINSVGALSSNTTISVIQAYNMDKKVDDGLPGTGNVQAVYINASTSVTAVASNTATSGGNATSCYDTTTSTYSITINNGSGGNCALSFKFQ